MYNSEEYPKDQHINCVCNQGSKRERNKGEDKAIFIAIKCYFAEASDDGGYLMP